MSDNAKMVITRADEVIMVYEHILSLEMKDGRRADPVIAVELTRIAFDSIHSQMEGGRMASVTAEGLLNIENGLRAVADSIVHVAGNTVPEEQWVPDGVIYFDSKTMRPGGSARDRYYFKVTLNQRNGERRYERVGGDFTDFHGIKFDATAGTLEVRKILLGDRD